jgi:hypothetical protein
VQRLGSLQVHLGRHSLVHFPVLKSSASPLSCDLRSTLPLSSSAPPHSLPHIDTVTQAHALNTTHTGRVTELESAIEDEALKTSVAEDKVWLYGVHDGLGGVDPSCPTTCRTFTVPAPPRHTSAFAYIVYCTRPHPYPHSQWPPRLTLTISPVRSVDGAGSALR